MDKCAAMFEHTGWGIASHPANCRKSISAIVEDHMNLIDKSSREKWIFRIESFEDDPVPRPLPVFLGFGGVRELDPEDDHVFFLGVPVDSQGFEFHRNTGNATCEEEKQQAHRTGLEHDTPRMGNLGHLPER